jgi:hypothetical protein
MDGASRQNQTLPHTQQVDGAAYATVLNVSTRHANLASGASRSNQPSEINKDLWSSGK